MRPDLLNIIACPVCKGRLALQAHTTATAEASEPGEVREGRLTCAPCNEGYPIVEGIPNLLPPALRDAAGAGP